MQPSCRRLTAGDARLVSSLTTGFLTIRLNLLFPASGRRSNIVRDRHAEKHRVNTPMSRQPHRHRVTFTPTPSPPAARSARAAAPRRSPAPAAPRRRPGSRPAASPAKRPTRTPRPASRSSRATSQVSGSVPPPLPGASRTVPARLGSGNPRVATSTGTPRPANCLRIGHLHPSPTRDAPARSGRWSAR